MFKNMKIGRKLIISFIIIALLASLSGLGGLWVISELNKSYSEALVNNGFVQGDLGQFNSALNEGASSVRDIIFLTEAQELQKAQADLSRITEETTEALDALKKRCQTPQELQYIAVIDKNLPLYRQARQEVEKLGLANQNDKALEYFRTMADPYLRECLSASESLIQLNIDMGNQVADKLEKQAFFFTVTILIVVVAVLAVSLLLGTYISNAISRPIRACSDRLGLLADGDLHTSVPAAESKDETGVMLVSMKSMTDAVQKIIQDIDHCLGQLAKGELDVETKVDYVGDFAQIKSSMDKIIVSLNGTLSDINRSADQVSSGSDQVSSGAQALSQGATEQASSVQELAATINEISSQVSENAKNAQQASARANQVGDEASESNRRMQDMLKAMEEISGSSGEIGKIIKTIEDIAFQTNILALNAAVEAARAGAAGKGFAVVADEVRNLANKSQQASKNTASLIDNSLKAVENGTRIADQTATSLASVVEGVKQVTDTINKISEASKEQATSISQVTEGVDQISSVVQTNSATAEESAAASEELSSQAQMLRNLVGRFHLKSADAGYAAAALPQQLPKEEFHGAALPSGNTSLSNY